MKKPRRQGSVHVNPLFDEDGVLPYLSNEGAESGIPHGEESTPRGYRVDEVNSALQKAIRRSEEENALYWAREFYEARRTISGSAYSSTPPKMSALPIPTSASRYVRFMRTGNKFLTRCGSSMPS